MFRAYRVFSVLQPRRPRHPIVQALLAVFAICAFLALLVVGAVIAVFVMIVATLARAFGLARPRATFTAGASPQPQSEARAADPDVIDAEFHVVDKSLPHGPRA